MAVSRAVSEIIQAFDVSNRDFDSKLDKLAGEIQSLQGSSSESFKVPSVTRNTSLDGQSLEVNTKSSTLEPSPKTGVRGPTPHQRTESSLVTDTTTGAASLERPIQTDGNKAALTSVDPPVLDGGRASSRGRAGHAKLKVIMGSKDPENSKIQAAVVRKKTSIYVGRLATHITADDVRDYLVDLYGSDYDFKVEQLTVKSGDYNSFKVETYVELLTALFDPKNWTQGVVIKKFRFFQPKNPRNY